MCMVQCYCTTYCSKLTDIWLLPTTSIVWLSPFEQALITSTSPFAARAKEKENSCTRMCAFLYCLWLHVQEAISVIETDCEVDFAPPLDYVEPNRVETPSAESQSVPAANGEVSSSWAVRGIVSLQPMYILSDHPVNCTFLVDQEPCECSHLFTVHNVACQMSRPHQQGSLAPGIWQDFCHTLPRSLLQDRIPAHWSRLAIQTDQQSDPNFQKIEAITPRLPSYIASF